MSAIDAISSQTFGHYLELFIWIFGAFIIGLFLGKQLFSGANKETDTPDAIVDNINLKEDQPKIRAKMTFERGGKTLKKEEKSQIALDFNRIGYGDASHSDDFKLISGIGPAMEKKLNELGLFNYKQLKLLTEKDLHFISLSLKTFPALKDPEKWNEALERLTH